MIRKIALFTLVYISIFSASLRAQDYGIVNLSVLPENPTINDSIRIAFHYYTKKGSDSLGLGHWTPSELTQIHQCVFLTPLNALRVYYDTLTIEPQPRGLRKVRFRLFQSLSSDTCSFSGYVDTTITYEVGLASSIGKEVKTSIPSIYPNPAQDLLYTDNQNSQALYIYDALGIRRKTILGFCSNHPAVIQDLEPGVYILRFSKSKGIQRIVIR